MRGILNSAVIQNQFLTGKLIDQIPKPDLTFIKIRIKYCLFHNAHDKWGLNLIEV